MKKPLTSALAVLTLATAAVSHAGPPPTSVSVKDDTFTPRVATQLYDSSTHWDWDDGVTDEHNVRQDVKLFYSGAPTDVTTTMYSETIPAGTFHYYCEEHGSRTGGMDGVVKVKPQVGPVFSDDFLVQWGDSMEVPVRWDVRFKVADGPWKPWQKNVSTFEATFGAGDDPVDVKPGRTYRFQARTERTSDPSRRSGWSPTLKVTTEEM